MHPPSASPAALRELVPRYLSEWARFAGRSLQTDAGLIIVDGFGVSGAVRDGNAVDAPLRVAAAVCSRLDVATESATAPRIVVVEEDPTYVERLAAELSRRGVTSRLLRTADLGELPPGEVALIHSAWSAAAEPITEWAGATRALYLLRPPQASALEWPSVRAVVAAPHADVFIYLPPLALGRLTAFGTTPVADIPFGVRRSVEGVSALLGDPRHAWLQALRRSGGGGDGSEMVWNRYREQVSATAGSKGVRSLEIRSAGESTPRRWFLITPDPRQSLVLNQTLGDLGVWGSVVWGEAERAPLLPTVPADAAVLDLFGSVEPQDQSEERRLDLPRLAEQIYARHRGCSVPYAEVLAPLATTDLVPDEVRRVLALLKRSGRAEYRSLAELDAPIHFPTTPSLPPPRRGRVEGPVQELFDG